eukprot:jgi/Mesvir1/19785/Mv13081-RA.2
MPGEIMEGGFRIPEVVDNEDGWGPSTIPENLNEIPYAPFSKGDKLGKAADWTNQGYNRGGRYGSGNNAPVSTVFNFFHNEDEDSFHLVDSRPAPRPKYGNRRFQNRFVRRDRDEGRRDGGRDLGGAAERERQRKERQQQQRKNQWNNYYHNRNDQRVTYNCSVDIRPEWSVLEQLSMPALTKLKFETGEPETLVRCGSLLYYDKAYDRVTPKTERPLQRFGKMQFHKVTTTDDPVIRRLAGEDAGTVFATDSILATLMCAPRSVYSWDIVVQRVGDKLFLDKRDNSFDLLTVSETSQEPIPDDKESINGVAYLSKEATVINQNFSQQVLSRDGGVLRMEEANPFASPGDGEVASVAYLYRRWNLSDDLRLVARCEVDSVVQNKGQDMLLSIKALNEFDSKATGVDWRQKLETQRGAVLATELKNNANKLAKWTVQALLAGVDQLKLGYVSRVHAKDNQHHMVLGTQAYKPREFATQINLNVHNMWGILKHIVEMCMKLDEGRYLLVKDPNKPLIRLYEVPTDAFENDYVEEPLPEVGDSRGGGGY